MLTIHRRTGCSTRLSSVSNKKAARASVDGCDTQETSLDFLGPGRSPRPAGLPRSLRSAGGHRAGRHGVVLKAFDPKLERVVAIKVLAPELCGNTNARKHFVREGRAAAAVLHDNVVTIHAVEEAAGVPYLVMQ